ncbi:hypothetical protein GCM10010520_23340 [Rhizobium viscosum]
MLQPAPRGEADLCPLSGAKGLEILVVDKSDQWNNAQVNRLARVINTLKDEIPQDYKLSIFTFQDKVEYGFPPIFSVCSPGRGQETSFWYGNPEKVQRKFAQMFGTPLSTVLSELQKPAEGTESPILEVLADITGREEFYSVQGIHQIILISDMLQNTELLNLFSQSGDNVDSAKVSQEAGARSFDEFSLRVYQIKGKYSQKQLDNAKAFWSKWATFHKVKLDWLYL